MKHVDKQARMAEEVDATFQEVFPETSSTDLFRLLPWCISIVNNPDVIPIHYMSEVLATIMQQEVDAPTATTTPESKDSQAPASMSSPACQTGTPSLPFLPMLDIPLVGTLQSGTQSLGSSLIPCTKSGIVPPVAHLMINLARGPVLKLQRLMSAASTALHRAKENHLKHHKRHPTMTQLPLGVLKNMTVRATPITVVMISLPKMS